MSVDIDNYDELIERMKAGVDRDLEQQTWNIRFQLPPALVTVFEQKQPKVTISFEKAPKTLGPPVAGATGGSKTKSAKTTVSDGNNTQSSKPAQSLSLGRIINDKSESPYNWSKTKILTLVNADLLLPAGKIPDSFKRWRTAARGKKANVGESEITVGIYYALFHTILNGNVPTYYYIAGEYSGNNPTGDFVIVALSQKISNRNVPPDGFKTKYDRFVGNMKNDFKVAIIKST